MVHAKSKKTAGLGNALMNDRFGKNRGNDRKKTSAITRYLTNERQEASWVKMRSVTEQGALDEFLATAELAGTDFTAEKMNNIKIIHTDQKNPYLLSGAEERGVLAKQKDHKGRLTRKMWAKYLKENGIAYRFFSASLAKEMLEALEMEESDSDEPEASSSSQPASKNAAADEESDEETDEETSEEEGDQDEGGAGTSQQEVETEVDDEDTRILTPGHKLQIGLVGYPNVGKSSTINALIGAKKVSVSSTPGKTKHFQTIHLSENVILCDCPGLVFPNFANTKADLVCNGVLPIDQLREFQGPAGLVTRRIPKAFLEAVYGINIKTRALEEGGSGIPTAHELLAAYAKARGFTTQGLGQPDESRASRYILKDYVNGKLLYCEPPPGTIDGPEFNQELYDASHLPEKRRQAVNASLDTMSFMGDDISIAPSDLAILPAGPKSKKIDKGFFGAEGTGTGHLKMPFAHKYSEQGQKHLSGRKARAMIALENGVDPKDVKLSSGKKHFKGSAKSRKGKKPANEDDD
ncbi:large subunit GTPase 1 [Colletotrichum spaethianum]|uniref:Large subunit GTPase 1 n=1 Tax=Colletotrichum spaethianum TaxID=700344 RepID=A0AA37UJZ9_9PEZI|nr:large subunit GTPase 1 [Colletotrichum spaethianum]GKT49156.1 large subunit GTPase 1 [Colletotrichum spaethianum]